MEDIALHIALLVAAGIGAQWLADRLRIAAILPLLLLGFLAGPVFGWLDPDRLFGDLLFVGVSLGVAIILFEGALTLRFADLAGTERLVGRLIFFGFPISAAVLAISAHLLLGFPIALAALFGAIASVSGPTVVVPLLRAVRPKDRLARALRWEGILIDPIGAVAAVILFETLLASLEAGSGSPWWWQLARVVVIGTVAGGIAGWLLGHLLRRHLIPDYLHNVATLAIVLLTFALANRFAHESGLVAVTVMGIVLANMRAVPREGILDFKESLSLLLISLLFILLAARVRIDDLIALGPAVFALLAALFLLARPLAVLASTLGLDIGWRERVVLAWIAPRGIVAAAISALFGLRLEVLGVPQAGLLAPLVFAVIVASVVVYSLTSRPLARILGVVEPEDHGALIVGANPVALAIARHLHELGVELLIADSNWNQIRAARLMGLRTFFGNPVSEQADRSIDLVGLGMLLALSRQPSLNALACLRYRSEFGSRHVFMIRHEPDEEDREAELLAVDVRGRLLFDPAMTWERLADALSHGATIERARIEDETTLDEITRRAGGEAGLLIAVDPAGSIHPRAEGSSWRPARGWWLIYLERAAADERQDAYPGRDSSRRASASPSSRNSSASPRRRASSSTSRQ